MRLFSMLVFACATAAAIFVAFLLYSNYEEGALGQGSTRAPGSSGNLPVVFLNATNMTENPNDSVYGQVVASNSNVFFAWQESRPSPATSENGYASTNYEIFMKKSGDEGNTFGIPINLSNNSGFSEHPQAAAYQDNVYAVWADDTSGNKEVLFARSSDNGTSFEKVTNLSNNTSDSFNQEIAVDGNDVYVVWLDEDETDGRILFKASTDAGKTFNEIITITDKTDSRSLPKVAASTSGAHVTWNSIDEANGLFYVKSSDKGNSFTEIKKLYDNFGEPQIVANGEMVFIVSGGLDSAKVNNLFLAKSIDGGENFTSYEFDGNGIFVNPLNVEAAVAGSDPSILYVAGQVFVSGNEEILLMALDDLDTAPKPIGIVNLSKNSKISECPSIAIVDDNIHVVWEDLTPGNHEILYAKSIED